MLRVSRDSRHIIDRIMSTCLSYLFEQLPFTACAIAVSVNLWPICGV